MCILSLMSISYVKACTKVQSNTNLLWLFLYLSIYINVLRAGVSHFKGARSLKSNESECFIIYHLEKNQKSNITDSASAPLRDLCKCPL